MKNNYEFNEDDFDLMDDENSSYSEMMASSAYRSFENSKKGKQKKEIKFKSDKKLYSKRK